MYHEEMLFYATSKLLFELYALFCTLLLVFVLDNKFIFKKVFKY